ncbi:MAG: dUTP diphosphatase [Treponema sp.]|nr:dUTP diphosphatase [Treponema sp.]
MAAVRAGETAAGTVPGIAAAVDAGRDGPRAAASGGSVETVVKFARKDPDVSLPRYESGGAAGMDLKAHVREDRVIPPSARVKIPTGLFPELPPGFEGQIRPRSGLAFRYGVTVLNAPGTIDADYRGELEILLVNLGNEPFTVKNGDRIAQMVVAPVCRVRIAEAESLGKTERGASGFGSTGM